MENLDTGNAPVEQAATEDLRVETTTEAPAETSSEPSIDDSLQAIWDKQNPSRTEDGKFASRNPQEPGDETEAPATEVQTPEAEKPEQVAKPAIEPPVSWTAEKKAAWAALPPDTQEYIAQRDREATATLSRMGNEVASLRPIANVIEQHKDVFAKHQMSPDRGVNLLIEAQRKLDDNPVAAIAEIARSYGVDLSLFAGGGQEGTQSPEVVMLRAELDRLKSELSETSGLVKSRVEQERQAELTTLNAEIDSFLTGKNVTENEISELAVLIEAEKRLNPGKPPKEVLSAAYEALQYRNPERREALIAQRAAETEKARLAEAEKKSAEAKKLGSLNVKSSPGSSSASRSVDDDLKEIARKHYGKI